MRKLHNPSHGFRKDEVRNLHDDDLLHVIVLTDTIMYRRLLTDNEISNFWLVIDERRDREGTK